jgi:hypothetical protein
MVADKRFPKRIGQTERLVRGRRPRFEQFEERCLLAITPLGSEFLVNSQASGSQETTTNGAVGADSGGNLVVAFDGAGPGSSQSVFAQRLDSSGRLVGAEFLADTSIHETHNSHSKSYGGSRWRSYFDSWNNQGNQRDASVAVAPDGRFVIAWSSSGSPHANGIFFQRFSASGVAAGPRMEVGSNTWCGPDRPALAIADNGDFVVAWSGRGPGDQQGVFFQRYSANGTPLSGMTRANSSTWGEQGNPAIAMAPDGRFVIAWAGRGAGDWRGIFFQQFAANGAQLGSEERANSTTDGVQQQPAVGIDAEGNFAIAWAGRGGDDGDGIFWQRYNRAGGRWGGEQRVNSTRHGTQSSPTVALASDGSAVLAWESRYQDGNDVGIFGQAFDRLGGDLSGEFLVNATTHGPQRRPSVALLDNGSFVVVWSGEGIGDRQGVFGRRYSGVTDKTPPVISAALSHDSGTSNSDGVTSDPSVQGTVNDNNGVATFRAGLDGASVATFSSVLAERGANGAFALNAGRLAQIAGGPLINGPHVLHLVSTDTLGNTSPVFNLNFTLDTQTPTIAAALQADTGQFNADGVTSNSTITGNLADNQHVASLRARFDSAPPSSSVNVFSNVHPDGSFVLSPQVMSQIGGGTLPDGPHTLHLEVGDTAGNSEALNLAFTLLTAAPPAPQFDLSAGSVSPSAIAAGFTNAARVTLVGHTGPNSIVRLLELNTNTLSSNTGFFQFPDVTVALGDNTFTAIATDLAGNTASFQRVIHRDAPLEQQDPVLRWIEATNGAFRLDDTTPPVASRALAMVSAAINDAVSSIEGKPTYFVTLVALPGASVQAAVSGAAVEVLNYLFPYQQSTFASVLSDALSQIPANQAAIDGLAFGRRIGDAIIALRSHDGWDDFVAYVPGTGPGVWQPTAPMYMAALLPQWATLTPFAMTTDSQFRPPAPPALTSQTWADAVNEVKTYGAVGSTARSADQTQIARFWADGAGTYTPPGHWNQVAAQIAAQQHTSLDENARLFAQLNIALGDAAIVAWDAKYTYNTWRPIDAIRQANTAGNPAVQPDPDWTPLILTPPFPEYVSGHSTFSGAAAAVLDSFFGENFAFSSTSAFLNDASGTPVTRSFASFDAAASEAGQSRIYGGIHFQFANQNGLAAGRALANFVLDTFKVSTDTQAPKILLDSPSGAIANQNVTITGHVLDNLSGVKSLQVQFDQASFTTISFDPNTGQFSIPTGFATDGTADSIHNVHLKATDFSQNVSDRTEFAFTLDTKAPTIAITSPIELGALEAGSLLTGTVDGTGSAITQLRYAFDGGAVMPVAYEASTGQFSDVLDMSKLGGGTHTLVVSAGDAAGNSATKTIQVQLAQPIPLAIVGHTPLDGASEVGASFRPKIIFSRPIDKSSLNDSNFFATDTTGAKLPATIVPADDGMFAWLFLQNLAPGASTITVNVNGLAIHAADGSVLDAANSGTPGSALRFQYSTVAVVGVPGTVLSGIVADPGPDLKPGSFDDVRAGPDGVLATGDDIYLHPIAHVKVFVIGQENQAVFTDAQGRFQLTAVPSGDIKLAIDGNTATNAPTGMYFPEMVMDLDIEPGQTNTVMGTMAQTPKEAASLQNDQGVYLPRLQSSLLTPIGITATTIGVDGTTAPNLTPEQQQHLTVTVPPNAAIGVNGQKMTNVKIGISTVPPELVRDMLPTGLMQLSSTITIQAPDVATFSTPIALTFPNLYGAAPGSKLDFYSFDHTTGRLEIEGTATVSADGLSVTTDPGSGITHPGWHGVAPPGDDGEGGPSAPPCDCCDDNAEAVNPTAATIPGEPEVTVLPLIIGEGNGTNVFSQKFEAAEAMECGASSREIHWTLEGKIQDFLEPTGDFLEQDAILHSGSGDTKTLSFRTRTYEGMFGMGGLKNVESNLLLGGKIHIRQTEKDSTGAITSVTDTTTEIYRFIDATDDKHADGQIEFEPAAPGVSRYKPIETQGVAAELIPPSGSSFVASNNEVVFTADAGFSSPVSAGATAELRLQTTDGREIPGTLHLFGEIVPRESWYLDPATFVSSLATCFADPVLMTDIERPLLGDKVGSIWVFNTGKATIFVQDVITRAQQYMSQLSPWMQYSKSGPRVNIVNPRPIADNDNDRFACSDSPPEDVTNLDQLILNYMDYSIAEQNFRLAKAESSPAIVGHTDIYLGTYFHDGAGSLFFDPWTRSHYVFAMARTITHEIGHDMGIAAHSESDVMASSTGRVTDPTSFTVTLPVIPLGLQEQWDSSTAQSALNFYISAAKLGHAGSGGASSTGCLPDGPGENAMMSLFDAPALLVHQGNDVHGLPRSAAVLDFGTVQSAGGLGTQTIFITNVGAQVVTDVALRISGGGGPFSVAQSPSGTIAPGQTVQVTLQYDPHSVGKDAGNLSIQSNSLNPLIEVPLIGFSEAAMPYAAVLVSNNNLGGVLVSSSAASNEHLAAITNQGIQPLVIHGFQMIEGQGPFKLLGVPSNLAVSPITLNFGETFTLGVEFDPDRVGLQRAVIQIDSNDPRDAIELRFGTVGTGLSETVAPMWGRDYVGFDTPRFVASTLHTTSDDTGHFKLFVPANTFGHTAVFDPETGLIGHNYRFTRASGQKVNLNPTMAFGASTAPDTDYDGLPDDVEYVIGTDVKKPDTNNDGIDDFAAIQQGLNPFGNRPFASGVVASLPLSGEAQALVSTGSIIQGTQQTTYVATGSYGLAIVDTSSFTQPIVLSQLKLTGNATGVAVDPQFNVAAVADNQGGLILVDVTNPTAPEIAAAIPVAASHVVTAGGIVYASVGAAINAYDLLSGEAVQELPLGGGTVKGLVQDGAFLYALDDVGLLSVIDITAFQMVRRGSTPLPVLGNQLFVGNGVAYIAAGSIPGGPSFATGGFETVNVSNPDHPTLIEGVDAISLGGKAIVTNGSGLAVAVGPLGGGSARTNVLDVIDVSDPTKTDRFQTQFSLPKTPQDVAIAAGLAFVADDTAGLVAVNYLSFDNQGVAPSVTIKALDLTPNPGTGQLQAAIGSVVRIQADIRDDVQVRNAELLVNGRVVQNDVTFPFDFAAIAVGGETDATITTVQVRSTDTGGNTTLSNVITIHLLPDSAPPTVVYQYPADGAQHRIVRAVSLGFSKPMDEATLTADNVQLLGPNGLQVMPSRVQLALSDRSAVFVVGKLPAGTYHIVLKAKNIKDRAGNALGTSDRTTSFEVTPSVAVWINPASGYWDEPANWRGGQLPGPDDDVLIDVPGDPTVTFRQGTATVQSIQSNSPLLLTGGKLTVDGQMQVNNTLTLAGGTLAGATVVPGIHGEGITATAQQGTLDGITLNAHLDITQGPNPWVTVINGMILNGTVQVGPDDPESVVQGRIAFEGPQSLTGGGTLVIGKSVTFVFPVFVDNALLFDDTLTIGSGITVRGGNGSIRGFGTSLPPLINEGTIVADADGDGPGFEFDVGATLTNHGILSATDAGFLNVRRLSGNAGQVALAGTLSKLTLNGNNWSIDNGLTAPTGTVLELDGTWTNRLGSVIAATDATLLLGAVNDTFTSWTNAGVITATNSAVQLRGAFTSADLANFQQTGGSIDLAGTLDLLHGSLTLPAVGSWRLRGGTLKNGTLASQGGAKLIATDSGGTLDNITANADLDITQVHAASMTVKNGLVLNSTLFIGSTSPTGALSTQVLFQGNQTLTGAGSVKFGAFHNGGNNTINFANSTLTIDGGIHVLSESNQNGRLVGEILVNKGTVAADGANAAVRIQASIFSFDNQGVLEASQGGRITIGHLEHNSGIIEAGVGGVISVEGKLDLSTSASGTVRTVVGGLSAGQFGQVQVTGNASLNGTLQVALSGGFQPTIGQVFRPLTYGSLTGAFANIDGQNVTYSSAYGATGLTLTAAAVAPGLVPGVSVSSASAGAPPAHSPGQVTTTGSNGSTSAPAIDGKHPFSRLRGSNALFQRIDSIFGQLGRSAPRARGSLHSVRGQATPAHAVDAALSKLADTKGGLRPTARLMRLKFR